MMESSARDARTQVIIVGAGPVGLLLACDLRRAGVPVVIVEKLAAPMTQSRASQLSTRTAEILHERGFDDLLAEAAHEPRAHLAGLPFGLSGLDSEYAGNWKVPQYRTEAALGARAERTGVRLLRGHELIGVEETSDEVIATIAAPVGESRIRGRYLVGCDGAGSAVRRLCGFGVTRTSATREMLRADVTGIDIPGRRFQRLPGGLAVAGTSDGVTRVMACAHGQGVAQRTGPPEFAEMVRVWEKVTGEDISAGTAIWVDSFDNSSGHVRRYRRGRVLLAGDAAHWHMPIGGQALNIGLGDAASLGPRLADAVGLRADPGVLDAYHDERHPVAARALRYVAAQETLLLGGPEVDPLRCVLAELIALEPVSRYLARYFSGLDDSDGGPGDGGGPDDSGGPGDRGAQEVEV